MADNVNNPLHYNKGEIETIDYMNKLFNAIKKGSKDYQYGVISDVKRHTLDCNYTPKLFATSRFNDVVND